MAQRPSALVDTRVIYCGDNLEQLAKLPAGCVDLIYIDPPFNSNRNYEVFWGETKEKRSFEDRHASTQAYIDYMRPAPGCVELARVLKKTGSFYYHCDWHASQLRKSTMNKSLDVALLWMHIEDHLIPYLKLDAHERSVYYHLVRRSRLIDQRTVTVSIDSLARDIGMSAHVRQHIRSLDAKGAIKILDRNRTGTRIEVLTPDEISGCLDTPPGAQPIDLEAFDFFTEPRGRAAIFVREQGRCFYCLRRIDESSAVLDHVIPQQERQDNSYRNIVGCCHECNSLKSGTAADDFVRLLFRRGRLNGDELETRLAALSALARGDLIPRIDLGGSPN